MCFPLCHVEQDTLQEEGLRGKLERYGLKPAASEAGLTMYRVRRP